MVKWVLLTHVLLWWGMAASPHAAMRHQEGTGAGGQGCLTLFTYMQVIDIHPL